MPDVVSIELLLDPETEAAVREDWRRLQDAGHSSLGAHTSSSNRPHVTLLVRPTLAPLTFPDVRLPIPVTLAEPVVFAHGDRGVLAWSVEPSAELVELHRGIHARVPEGEDAAHTRPGEWTPHVTLARRLRLDALPDALALLGPPRTGSGVAIRRWDAATRTVSDMMAG